MNKIIETQLLLLAPIIPFICEETWEEIGKEGYISLADWPEYEEQENKELIVLEDIVRNTLSDIRSVLKITGIKKPEKITLFTAPQWKYDFFKELSPMLEKTRDFSKIMGNIMKNEKFKKHGQEISKLIRKYVQKGKTIEQSTNADKEFRAINEAKEFFEKEFRAEIEVKKAKDSKENKSKKAMPNKPAILVE